MNPDFWKTIGACGGDYDRLKALLATQTDEQVTEFCKSFYQGLINLNQWQLWGAGFVMAGGMSDDGFHYFRSWILGKGKEAYDIALTSPDDLGKFAEEEDEFDNELLEYAGLEVLEGRGLPDPREDFEASADDSPSGEEWDEEEVYAMFPKLSATFE